MSSSTISQTQNREWGFFGAICHHADPERAWDIVLTRAAQCPDRHLEFHRKPPMAARHTMIDALLRDCLITEIQGDYRLGDEALHIESTATCLKLTTLTLTGAGLRALNRDPPGIDETPDMDATVAPTVASDTNPSGF